MGAALDCLRSYMHSSVNQSSHLVHGSGLGGLLCKSDPQSLVVNTEQHYACGRLLNMKAVHSATLLNMLRRGSQTNVCALANSMPSKSLTSSIVSWAAPLYVTAAAAIAAVTRLICCQTVARGGLLTYDWPLSEAGCPMQHKLI
jgi:hypothetical protein